MMIIRGELISMIGVLIVAGQIPVVAILNILTGFILSDFAFLFILITGFVTFQIGMFDTLILGKEIEL